MTPVFSPVNGIINRLAEGKRVHPKESMRHESLRLCTFRTYPTYGKPSCIKLAKAGFYYASQGDEVICYCCAKRISNWNEKDDPMRAHRLVSPSCPFLIGNSEVNEPVTNDSIESSNPRLNRILQSLDTSDEQSDREERNSGPAANEEFSPLCSSNLNSAQNGAKLVIETKNLLEENHGPLMTEEN
ncbi:baculoviral IAP repeat-containing protein 2-like [Dreissena polymorpha]|uniref:baculoviral IAP repeat-containing protein 2-like n=1 Tax=Dreissena polymorpha TaxID=45954 RepID=UPI0022643AF7|nr:baculoviral IAP repeat-containing protein 2-like [Dreissena polymorpha]